MSSTEDDVPDLGDFGAPMNPPTFSASDGPDDKFSIDLPEDDEPDSADGEISAPQSAAASPGGSQSRKRGAVMGLPIDIVISVGRARPLLTELVSLRRDSVIALDSKIDDPVELIVGDKVIARGELQEIEPETGRLGVRLTEVADPREGR